MTPSEGERRAKAGANARPPKIAQIIVALKWGSRHSRTPPPDTAYVARRPSLQGGYDYRPAAGIVPDKEAICEKSDSCRASFPNVILRNVGADGYAHAAVGWRRVLQWPGGKLTDLPSSAFEVDGHRTGGRLGRVHDREAPTALDAHTGHLNRRLGSLIRPTPEQEREDAGAPLAAQRRRAPEALDDRLRNR